MANILGGYVDLWRGSEPTLYCSVSIIGGGTDRAFYLRIGALGAKAYLEKTMAESNSTDTAVDLDIALTADETNGIPADIVDFQIISTSPVDVLLEGKFKMRKMIRAPAA